VKGKTVVMLVNDPGFATKDENLFKGNAMTYYGRWTYKYEEAARQGAEAVIVIHETEPASYGWNVVSGSWTGEQYDLVRPDRGASRSALEGWITYEKASKMFADVGLDLAKMKSDAAIKGFKPVPAPELKLSAQIDQSVKTTASRNVAGVLKGATRPDEYVLYMAHWDHLGTSPDIEGDDKIFNGAVDNASGTAAIIEVAETMVERGTPDRSVIFVAVTAEESGLLGSAYYGEKPLVPLAQTVGGINIDAMLPVGETKDMKVIGFGSSELEDLLKRQLEKRGMYVVPDDKPEAGYFYRSDHISLAKLGVPMLYADPGNNHITKGMTYGEKFGKEYTKERYHKVSDEYDNSWDLSGIVQATDIMLDMGYELANSEQWPNWYEGTEFRGLRDEMLDGDTQLICLTDDPTDVNKKIRCEPIPDINLPDNLIVTPWRKLVLWKDKLAGLSGDVLFLDLDLVITGNLDEMFDFEPGRFCVIENWTQPGKNIGNTSCFRWNVGSNTHIFDK